MTDQLRKDCQKLFVNLKPPHRPATAATIGSWIKQNLRMIPQGEGASAHSVRGVVTSYAQSKGVSLRDIMIAAQWTNSDVFFRSYRIPDAHEVFQKSLFAS